MGELKWTAKIVREMRDAGAMVYALSAKNSAHRNGWPDRLVVDKRWSGLLEFKGVNTLVSPIQEIKLRALSKRWPGHAFVVRRPGTIESIEPLAIWGFDRTGRGLLLKLAYIQKEFYSI